MVKTIFQELRSWKRLSLDNGTVLHHYLNHNSHVAPAIIGNTCYLLGGYANQGVAASRRVFSVCLNDLISQQSTENDPSIPSPWQSLPDIPLVRSTALAFNGALLAVGGCRESTLSNCKVIYYYQPSSRNWIKAGEMPTGRSHCSCTVLPSGDLYMAGGGVLDDNVAQSIVDIASMIYMMSVHGILLIISECKN